MHLPTIIQNPTIEHSLFDSKNLKLYEITTSTKLTPLPYSNDSGLILTRGTNVVLIGHGYIQGQVNVSDGEPENLVRGYDYYLVNQNGTNYYGYLPVNAVTEIQQKHNKIPYAYTRKNINIYKYPTASEDSINTIIELIENASK
jgi:hypothetical protein